MMPEDAQPDPTNTPHVTSRQSERQDDQSKGNKNRSWRPWETAVYNFGENVQHAQPASRTLLHNKEQRLNNLLRKTETTPSQKAKAYLLLACIEDEKDLSTAASKKKIFDLLYQSSLGQSLLSN